MDLTHWLGDIDPFDPATDELDLQEGQEYLEWLIAETRNPSVREEAIWQYSAIGYIINRHSLPRYEIIDPNPWVMVKDGDVRAWNIFQRHYSFDAKKARANKLIVGPGFKTVLVVPDPHNPNEAQALFVWRLERLRDDANYGACCAVFRNETKYPGSYLIECAEEFVALKWPFIPRLYTFIDTTKVLPYANRKDPKRKKIWGRAYRFAGWWPCGWSKKRLQVFEKIFLPWGATQPWRYQPPQREEPDYWPQRPTYNAEWLPTAGGWPLGYDYEELEEIANVDQLSLFAELPGEV